ncbi:MAG: helix-turn-helix domain-containing protein [bacterium]|nr:helix-turn-helix domain-containing protein [bacterium]
MKRAAVLMHLVIKLSLIIYLVFPAPTRLAALDPKQPIDHYLLDEWNGTKNSGLTNLSIYNIIQSSDHFLWFEIYGDVVRFDGLRFTPANQLILPHSKHAPQEVYNILLNDKDGTLWLEGDKGLIKYRDNQIEAFIPLDSFPWDDFSLAVEDSWGNFWLGTMGGSLYRLSNLKKPRLTEYGTDKGLPGTGISSILEDKHGNLWVAAFENGIFKLKDNRFEQVKIKGLTAKDTVTWLYEDRSGAMWIATSKGLFREKDDEIVLFTTENGLSHNEVGDVYEDSDGIIWAGTDKGINRLRKDASGKIVIDHLLENEIVNVIIEDKEKNLWIGTEGSGIRRLRNRFFHTISIKTDRQDYISALHHTQSGETWVGTLYGDLIRMENNKPAEQFQLDDYISSLCDDKKGNLWVGTTKNGLFCLTPDRKIITYNNDPSLKNILTLYAEGDPEHRLWIGTRNGLSIYHQGKFTSYQGKKGIPGSSIEYIYPVDGQDTWVGGYNGLYTLDKGKAEPKSVHHLLKDEPVSFAFKDPENTIWVATSGIGLYRYKDKKFLLYDDCMAQPVFAIYRILEDRDGYFWFSSNVGICRVKRGELNHLADKKIKDLNLNIFGVSDGLNSRECSGTSYNSAIKLPNGEFWFATKKGIAVFRPGNVQINKQPPKVFIQQVTLNREPTRLHSKEKSFKSVESIRFHFTAPTFISQEGVLFKFKLEGYDKDWLRLHPGERRTVEYRKLPGGDYRFRVTACNSDGVWSKEGTALPFAVSSDFFKSNLFLILISSGIPLLLFLAYFLYVRSGLKEVKKQQPLPLDVISRDKYLVKLLHLLEEQNIYREESVSLKTLAEQLEISTRQLSKLINEKLDKTFYDLINYYRIEEAKRMLLDEKKQMSIIEIAFYVGFNSKSSFNQAFKKQTGLTPSEFKKRF